jgi:uncharacterized membrane protein YfcA
MSELEWAVALVVVAMGAVIQGSIGFGLNLVAAPVIVLMEPSMVPGPLLVTAFAMTAFVAIRERAALDLRGLGWALAGRVPGVVLGTWAVTVLSQRALEVGLGAIVLAATVASVVGVRVVRRPETELVAGALSGFTGTTTSIGGPPMGLLYQHDGAALSRANISWFLLFGVGLSIALLAVADEFHTDDLGRGGALVPAVLTGFLVSRRLTPALDRGYSRPAVLVASAVGAVLVLGRALFS